MRWEFLLKLTIIHHSLGRIYNFILMTVGYPSGVACHHIVTFQHAKRRGLLCPLVDAVISLSRCASFSLHPFLFLTSPAHQADELADLLACSCAYVSGVPVLCPSLSSCASVRPVRLQAGM